MKTAKRITASILCALMLVSLLPLTASAAYENTHTNTGNQIEDLIAVAESQIGYTEGNSTSQMGGTASGNGNYTKYGAWYGINPGAWCAMFVSWCANQAGIPSSIVYKHSSCDYGMQWFQNNGVWQWSPACGGSYVPKRGDIIYFRTNTSQVIDSTHVGIVYNSNSSTVYTIEGNTSNKCARKSYSLSSAYILGYGTPKYTSGAVSYSTGTYKVTASSLNMRDAASSSGTNILQALPNGAVVNVTLISGSWGYTTYNGISGWIHLGYCQLTQASTTYTMTFDPNGGTMTSGYTEYSITPGTKYSSVMSSAPTATRNGYTLGSWYCEKHNYTFSIGDTFSVKEDVTLVAQWTAKLGLYTITTASSPLNIRSGAGSSEEILGSVPKGTVVNITTIYGDWGYITYNGISGWVSLAYCTYYGSASSVTETYTLTLDVNGGTLPSGISSTYEFEPDEKFIDVIGVFPVPTRSGYEFTGWKNMLTGTSDLWNGGWGTQPYTFGTDITIQAQWTAHTHSYTSAVTKAATCNSAGVRTYTCNSCGNTYTEAIAQLNHNYSSSVTKEPTCDAYGTRTYTCSLCGSSYTENIAKLDHSYTSTVTKQASCTAVGVTTHTCSKCGDSYTTQISAQGHDYISHEAKAPTCTATGYNAYQTCSRCSYSSYSVLAKLEHSYALTNGAVTCSSCNAGYNGFFTDDTNSYYCVNGAPKTKLFTVEGNIYYANTSGVITKSAVVLIPASEKGSILTGSDSFYAFGSDGKLTKTGFVSYEGNTVYYNDTVMVTGLYKVESDYYYFDETTGYMLTNTEITIQAGNTYGLEAGSYLVRPDGKLYFSDVEATITDGKIYVDGVMQTNGLYNIDSKYYYAGADGSLVKEANEFVYYANGIMPRAYYHFDANGAVMTDGWLNLGDGRTYFFKSAAHVRGLQYIDGSYYFFNTQTAELIKSDTVYVGTNSYGLNAGVYSIASDGKLTVPATTVAETAIEGSVATALTGAEAQTTSNDQVMLNNSIIPTVTDTSEKDDDEEE